MNTLCNVLPHETQSKQPSDPRAVWWKWLAVLMAVFVGSIGLMMVGRLRRATAWIVVHHSWHWAFAGSIVFGMPNRWLFHALLILFPVIWFGRVIDTFRVARTAPNTKRWYQQWYWYVLAIAVSMFVWNAMLKWNRKLLLEVFRVPMRAMADTVLPEDRIMVSKWDVDPHRLRYRDIVVFYANGKADAPLLVMRIVGLPGDRLRMKDRQLYRNGAAVNESDYVQYRSTAMNATLDNFDEVVVPPGCYYVLGDNRYLAWDSRRLDCIPFAQHYGKAIYVFWSLFSKMSDDPADTFVETGPLRWDRIGLRLE